MNSSLFQQFENRLRKVDKHLRKLARRQDISCFQVYDHDLPEFPFVIDRYNNQLYVAEYQRQTIRTEDEQAQWKLQCFESICDVLEVPCDLLHLKQRRRKADASDQYQKADDRSDFMTVTEGSLKFDVNLTDYLDTGLFLDHRSTRSIVRDQCNRKRVLNLFCYTGSFSVYAADGNAAEVTSVDLSNTYLRWAERNMKLNGLYDPARHHYVRADVLQYISQLPSQSYDLVIMDPPTFSNSKSMEGHLDIQRDHVNLINQTLRTMTEGGLMYFSTNFRKFSLDKDAIAATLVRDITRQTTPFDFQSKMLRWCFCIVK